MCRVIPLKELSSKHIQPGITKAYPHVSICFVASIRITTLYICSRKLGVFLAVHGDRCAVGQPGLPVSGAMAWKSVPMDMSGGGALGRYANMAPLDARERSPSSWMRRCCTEQPCAVARQTPYVVAGRRVRRCNLGRPAGVHAVGSRPGRCGQRAHRVAAVPGLGLGAGMLSTLGGCPTPAGRPSEASCRPRSGRTRCVVSTCLVTPFIQVTGSYTSI